MKKKNLKLGKREERRENDAKNWKPRSWTQGSRENFNISVVMGPHHPRECREVQKKTIYARQKYLYSWQIFRINFLYFFKIVISSSIYFYRYQFNLYLWEINVFLTTNIKRDWSCRYNFEFKKMFNRIKKLFMVFYVVF